jgi:broad specificity phosphatase PhoE
MPDQEPKKVVYFIRHGQSEANGNKIFQGADSPLSPRGREQALFVAERLRTTDAQVILASPMPRALDTARAIEQTTSLPLEVHTELRELLPPSALVGKSYDGPEGLEYTHQRVLHHSDPHYRYEDEESYSDLHERACSVLSMLEARPEDKLIVVTHAGFMRVVMTAMMTEGEPHAYIAGRLMRFLVPENTGITVFRFNPEAHHRTKWRLVTFNDHAHLAETSLREP